MNEKVELRLAKLEKQMKYLDVEVKELIRRLGCHNAYITKVAKAHNKLLENHFKLVGCIIKPKDKRVFATAVKRVSKLLRVVVPEETKQ